MRNKIPIVFLVSAFLSALLAPNAEAVPTVPATGLEVQITERGKISLSADGVGSNDPAGATVQVEKPNAAATVRSAIFACASNLDRVINDGDVSLDGNPTTWAASVQNNLRDNLTFFNNVFANVTAIVKPKVDAAVPGLVDFTQTEVNTDSIDGCALHVVFDDPSQTTDNTVFILFGGQNTTGDDFAVTLATPLSGSDRAEMGLGISFSFQGSEQFSQIDVNRVRLTTSAGGQDDGAAAGGDGRLLTVGGIGDSTANPADPNAPPAGDPRIDDELYDLRPFVGPSDTNIFVQTLNPSGDDNIFAGHIFVTKPAIIGDVEGILLTPLTSTNPIGTPHTVTARVVNALGQPVSDRVVDFQVKSGPNAGTSNSGTTNANGETSFTYTGTGGVGTDIIDASFTDSAGRRRTSHEVQKRWVLIDANPPVCSFTGTSGSGTATDNQLSEDTGIFSVLLDPGSTNLVLNVDPFTPGAGVVNYTVTVPDPTTASTGGITATDGAGNTCNTLITPTLSPIDSNDGPPPPFVCNGPACRVPLRCNGVGISCRAQVTLFAFVPRARLNDRRAAQAVRRIRFAASVVSVPPGEVRAVRLRLKRGGRQIVESGTTRRLRGLMEIRNSVGGIQTISIRIRTKARP